MNMDENKKRLKIENYVGVCIVVDFLDNTKISGRLLAVSEDYLLINLMDEGFIEVIVFKQAIKHLFKYEL